MAEDGFRTLRVKAVSRSKLERLRERLLAMGARVPARFYTEDSKTMEAGSVGATFDVVCELAGEKLDEIDGKVKR